jgi:integrase
LAVHAYGFLAIAEGAEFWIIGDAAALSWSSVDIEDQIIRYRPQKTSRSKKVLTVPMHPEILIFLERHKPESTDLRSPCFPTLQKKLVGGRSGLSDSFSEIMVAAGIERREERARAKNSAGRATFAYSFHSLRHSFVSLMANEDVSAELRMKLAGHSKVDVHEVYTSTEVTTLRRAINAIPRLDGGA